MVGDEYRKEERGQGFIFDAIVGGAVLIAAITLTIYTVGLPPAEVTSPSEATLESEVKKDMNAVLESSEQDGSLKTTVLSWKNNTKTRNRTRADGYSIGSTQNATGYAIVPKNSFGERIDSVAAKHSVDYRVIAIPHSNASNPGGRGEAVTILSQTTGGVTSSYAVSKTIQLHDRDTIRPLPSAHDSYSVPVVSGASGKTQLQNLPANATYPIPEGKNSLVGSRTYNRVDVKVVIYEQ
jgi:hypothetical protein